MERNQALTLAIDALNDQAEGIRAGQNEGLLDEYFVNQLREILAAVEVLKGLRTN